MGLDFSVSDMASRTSRESAPSGATLKNFENGGSKRKEIMNAVPQV